MQKTWESKIIVENKAFNVNCFVRKKVDAFSCIHGMRQGPALKKGYLLPKRRIKKSRIRLTE